MKRLIATLALVASTLLACNGNEFTSPSELPTLDIPIPGPTEPERPPVVAMSFSWDLYQGYTAFALGHPGQDEGQVLQLVSSAMSHGWNTPRVCAETEFWPGSAAYPIKPRDTERLRWLLDTLARVPGVQVLIIGNCTLKGPVPLQQQTAWAAQVAEVASRFPNVAVETHNEFDNCRGRGWGPHCPGKQDVREQIQIYRSKGIQYVTADDSVCAGADAAKTYEFRLRNVDAYPADFHPCRGYQGTPAWDPSIGYLRKLAEYNGLYVLSETVAWMDFSGTCSGLRTCDRERIESYIRRCAKVEECKFTYHSEALLAGQEPTWFPEAK